MNRLFRTARALAFLACASSILTITASAQSVYGSIFGTVSDKSGAVIPGATVTVTDEAKGTVVTVTSNGSGDYSVPHLIPDVYDLRVVAKGFKPFETKGVSVQADTAPRVDPTMDVGSDTGTTVEVSAESVPLIKTDKADVATVFDQQQMSSLAGQRTKTSPACSCFFPAPRFSAGPTQRMKIRRDQNRSRLTARRSVERPSSWTAPTTRTRFSESLLSTRLRMQ